MEFSIKLNEQDICATKPETVASLFMALREISLDSMKVAEQKADKMVDTVCSTHHKAQAQEKAETAEKMETPKAKTDEPKPKKEATPKEEPKPKEEPAPAKDEPKEEPEKTEEPAATETKTADDEKPEIDREAIVEKIKKIAFEGKAEGKPKKMKALLAEYGVEKLPDLPDDKLPEFLKKVEAL